jgi:hypothetical protein
VPFSSAGLYSPQSPFLSTAFVSSSAYAVAAEDRFMAYPDQKLSFPNSLIVELESPDRPPDGMYVAILISQQRRD